MDNNVNNNLLRIHMMQLFSVVIEQTMAQAANLPQSHSQQFELERTHLLQQSQENILMTKLRTQLTNKVEAYKKLQSFKEQLAKKARELKARSIQLETHSKTLSDSQKKQYPVFIKFITKQIKTVVLELGKKFNKLNQFQKMQLISYLTKHHENNKLVQHYLKLFRQRHKTAIETSKKVNEQKMLTLQKKMEIEELKNYNQKLVSQKERLIEAKKTQKKVYDGLKQQIITVQKDTTINSEVLESEKKKYLRDFNVAVCRERIHVQYVNQLKEAKLANILNDSVNDVESAQRKRAELRGYLRNKTVANILGNVVSYNRKEDKISISLQKVKISHQKNFSKTDHTESTALKTRQSALFTSQFH